MTLFILMFAGFSLLVIGLSVPMIAERVKPNGWYGFRIPLTLNNPKIWYAANRYAGWLLLGYGLVLLLVSLGLPFLLSDLPEEPASEFYALVICVVSLAGLIPLTLLSLRFAHRLGKEYEQDDKPQVS